MGGSLSTEKCVQLGQQSNTTRHCPKIEAGYCVHELCSCWPTKIAFKITLLSSSLPCKHRYMYNVYLGGGGGGGGWRKIIKYTVMLSTLCDVYCVALIKGVAFYVLKQKGELIIP